MMAAVNGVEGSSILELVDTPIAEVQTRMPGITTALYQQYGAQLNWMIAVNDLYFDFAIPTLRTLGVPPSGPPQMVSGGDGSVSAYDRVRQGQYQAATIPEPLNLHGWQAIDEMNRAFAGAPPSGYVTPGSPGHPGQHPVRRRPEQHLRSGQRLSRPVQANLGHRVTRPGGRNEHRLQAQPEFSARTSVSSLNPTRADAPTAFSSWSIGGTRTSRTSSRTASPSWMYAIRRTRKR